MLGIGFGSPLFSKELIPQDSASAGSVSTVDGVDASSISLRLIGEKFSNDLLAGGATYTAIDADFYLYRINTSGTITYEIFRASSSGATTPTANTESVFSLSDLGNFDANDVLILESLGVTVTTSDTWTTIDSATGYSTAIWPILAPYRSGYQPSIISEVRNSGGNLAKYDLSDIGSIGYNTSGVAGRTGGVSSLLSGGFTFDDAFSIDFIIAGMDAISVAATSDNVEGPTRLAYNLLDINKTFISGAWVQYTIGNDTYSLDDISIPSNAHYFRLTGYTTAAGYGADISNIQLNQGSTANDYSEPLYSPAVFGSRSENQLRNGNGEMGTYGWDNSNYPPVWDTAENAFKLTKSAGDAYVRTEAFDCTDPVTFIASAKDDGTTIGRLYLQTYVDGVQSDIPSGTPSGWTDIGSGYYRIDVGTTYDDVLLSFSESANGINQFQVEFWAITSAGDMWFKEVQLIKGEYTLAQLQAKGYVSYEPILAHAVDGVTDEIYTDVNGKTWLKHNVATVDGYVYGDPVIDTTELVTDGDMSNPASWSTSSKFSIASGVASYDGTDIGYITPATPFVPITGSKVVIEFDISNLGGSTGANIIIANQGAHTIIADTTYELFQEGRGKIVGIVQECTPATTNWRLYANTGGDSFDIDNISMRYYNIQENLSPATEDITEFVSGSLVQPAVSGQNHIVADSANVKATWYAGLAGVLDTLKRTLAGKAEKTELKTSYRGKVVLPAMTSGDAEVFTFEDLAAADSQWVDYIDGASVKEITYGDTDLSNACFDNAIVIIASGAVADDTEVEFEIGPSKGFAIIDRSA